MGTRGSTGSRSRRKLGHIRLHRPVLRQVRSVEDADALHASEHYEYMERNAKWFASALLMPREPLLRDVRQLYAGLVKQHGFDHPEPVRRSLVIRLSQHYVVEHIADAVSPRTLAVGGA